MARCGFIPGAALFLICLTVAATARCDDAESSANAGAFIPGFEGEQLTWSQVERIQLIEGITHETDARGKAARTQVSSINAYRFADGDSRPFSATNDPLATPLPGDQDHVDHAARLKERAAAWKNQIQKHNPAIRLDIVHRDSRMRMQLMSGIRTSHDVHLQETFYMPPEELVAKARAVDTQAILEKTKGHADNKTRAKLLYYAVNGLLGCAAAAIIGFVLTPVFRRRRPSAGQPAP